MGRIALSDRPSRRVFIATDVRVHRRDDGVVECNHSAAAYEVWLPYVRAFGSVSLVARCEDRVLDGPVVSGPGVHLIGVPSYRGWRGLLLRAPALIRSFRTVGDAQAIFIGRLPEPLSLLLFLRARILKATFISLVVSEPRELIEAYFPGQLGRVLGLMARLLTRTLVMRSQGVVYVSEKWLQTLYPPPCGVPTLARSNVVLDEEAFVQLHPVLEAPLLTAPKLLSIGVLTGRSKGMDLLIRVVAELRARHIEATLTIIGSGTLTPELQSNARSLGVASAVRFTGQLHDREQIRAIMDESDIYLSASRAEGLPRSTVEAMARGLPVITSNAGAARELLSDPWIVPVGDVTGMVQRVERLCHEPATRTALERACLERAKVVARLAEPVRLTRFLTENYA